MPTWLWQAKKSKKIKGPLDVKCVEFLYVNHQNQNKSKQIKTLQPKLIYTLQIILRFKSLNVDCYLVANKNDCRAVKHGAFQPHRLSKREYKFWTCEMSTRLLTCCNPYTDFISGTSYHWSLLWVLCAGKCSYVLSHCKV